MNFYSNQDPVLTPLRHERIDKNLLYHKTRFYGKYKAVFWKTRWCVSILCGYGRIYISGSNKNPVLWRVDTFVFFRDSVSILTRVRRGRNCMKCRLFGRILAENRDRVWFCGKNCYFFEFVIVWERNLCSFIIL